MSSNGVVFGRFGQRGSRRQVGIEITECPFRQPFVLQLRHRQIFIGVAHHFTHAVAVHRWNRIWSRWLACIIRITEAAKDGLARCLISWRVIASLDSHSGAR